MKKSRDCGSVMLARLGKSSRHREDLPPLLRSELAELFKEAFFLLRYAVA